MVTKATKNKSSRVKVGKLRLNKETVKDLTDSEAKRIKGGLAPATEGCGPSNRCESHVHTRCGVC